MRHSRNHSSIGRSCLATVVVLLAASLPAFADDLSRRWQVGGGISFQSTQGSIRSNAAFLLLDSLGNDGIPNSGDEEILFRDPRRDSLVERETTLDEKFRFDLMVAYGITSWFSVQLDAAYFETEIVQFDTFVTERRYVDNGDGILFFDDFCGCVTEEFFSSQSRPMSPATVKQLPVTLSGVFRFWSSGSVNLYATAGVGYLRLDIEESPEFQELTQLLSGVRLLELSTQQLPARADPRMPLTLAEQLLYDLYVIDSTVFSLPNPGPISITGEDTVQYSLGVGVDYFFNSHWALDFEMRYLYIPEDIRIDVSGYDQLNYVYVSPDDLPVCSPPFSPGIFPPDFDPNTMGIPDLCRPTFAFPLRDEVLVQGGDINLSAFTFKMGVRYAF